MGSSKKKKDKDRDKEHKEHKRKRRHRSRSRSRDRHDKKRKDEKKRKREYEPDLEVPSEREHVAKSSKILPKTKDSTFVESGGGEHLSLSIEATNKIRAKLGLKPLDLPGSSNKDDDDSKPSKKEDVHVPATNMAQVKKTEELRQKMLQMKEKRRINMMLGKVKALADDSDDEGALGWVRRSRKHQEEKEKADKQAKLLEEMDAAFGVGELVEEVFKTKKKYSSKDLSGLKVLHDQERFNEGKTIILTLKDKGVLDEDDDTLVNVNLQDDERADKYKDNKKKKPDYNPYDEEYDQYGTIKPKDILDKYDEEIHGKKMDSFQLGRGGKYNTDQERRMEQMKRDIQAKGESLTLPPPSIASEYYTETEMQSFNKIKKKVRKIRMKQKMITADDLLPLPGDNEPQPNFGEYKKSCRRSRKEPEHEEGEILDADPFKEPLIKLDAIPGLDLVDMEVDKTDPYEDDMTGPYEDLEGVKLEEDKASLELELALRKTRRLKQKKDTKDRDKKLAAAVLKQEPDEEMSNDQSEQQSGTMVLNVMSEFCRSLGEIPTYGMAGNRVEEEDELVDLDQEMTDEHRMEMGDEHQPGWQQVEIDTRPVQIKQEEKAVLDDEPVVNEGLAAALELANKKGYLEKQSKKSVSAPKHEILTAKNYSIEDKRYDDLDEKFRKRDRFSGGMISDFKEKTTYKPDVKLEYIDEGGRLMNQKEAFRYLSHRFHGKGSGKKKTEKRQKKQEEIQLMKTMSSTDTPLGTVALLTEKQKVEKTHYVVLSGGGKGTATLSK